MRDDDGPKPGDLLPFATGGIVERRGLALLHRDCVVPASAGAMPSEGGSVDTSRHVVVHAGHLVATPFAELADLMRSRRNEPS